MHAATADPLAARDLARHIYRLALRPGAVRVHVEPFGGPLRVRVREAGRLREALQVPGELAEAVADALRGQPTPEPGHGTPQPGRPASFLGRLDHEPGRPAVLVDVLPGISGDAFAIQSPRQFEADPGLEDLGFEPQDLARVEQALARRGRAILVLGPPEEGVGDTLRLLGGLGRAAFPQVIQIQEGPGPVVEDAHVVRIDRRVEPRARLAVERAARQGPDRLVVDPSTDLEAFEECFRVALAGVQVLVGAHAHDAGLDMAGWFEGLVHPELLEPTLELVVHQRRVRRLCPECRRPDPGGRRVPRGLRHELARDRLLWRAVGCAACEGTGTQGFLTVLAVTPRGETLVAALLQRRGVEASAGALRRAFAPAEGLLAERLRSLLRAGCIDLAEAARALPEGAG